MNARQRQIVDMQQRYETIGDFLREVSGALMASLAEMSEDDEDADMDPCPEGFELLNEAADVFEEWDRAQMEG